MLTKVSLLLSFIVSFLLVGPASAARVGHYPDGVLTLPPLTTALVVSPSLLKQALWVHHCEEAAYGWHVNGPIYFGGLGWKWATWQQFRRSWMPVNMANATIREQAWALGRFAHVYEMPDLNGTCNGY